MSKTTTTTTSVKDEKKETKLKLKSKPSFQPDHTLLCETISIGSTPLLKGWIRDVRSSKKVVFAEFYDGTTDYDVQLVFDKKHEKYEKELDKVSKGATVAVKGLVQAAKKHKFEMLVTQLIVIGPVTDKEQYLPSQELISVEKDRKAQHLRPKMKRFQCIDRIAMCGLKHYRLFFEKKHVKELLARTLTTSDCEGGGETFSVIPTKAVDKLIDKIKTGEAYDSKKSSLSDYTGFEKFFGGKSAFLQVSTQLPLEAATHGTGSRYIVLPSFRAEQSHTCRHAAEFTHVEAELTFITFKDLMCFIEEMFSYVVQQTLIECERDLDELEKTQKGLKAKLTKIATEPFARVSYRRAILLLKLREKQLIEFSGGALKQAPKAGEDLGTYCEKFLCECIFKQATIVFGMPWKLKSFYMKRMTKEDMLEETPVQDKLEDVQSLEFAEEKEDDWTVQGCDLLVPYSGASELVGASIREEKPEPLLSSMKAKDVPIKPLKWYTDLRETATVPTGGFGLGFERHVMIVTSMDTSESDYKSDIRSAGFFYATYEELDL